MALGSCLRCLKYCVFIFNFIFWLLSIGLLGVGIWLRVDQSATKIVEVNYDKLHIYYTICYVIIAVGAVMFLVSFLGCCGAYQESVVLLGFFFGLLVIVFLGEVGGGIYAYTQKDEIAESFKKSFKDFVQNGYSGGQDIQSRAIDWVQQELECCGGDDMDDWISSYWMKQDPAKRQLAVPDSCCRSEEAISDHCPKLSANLATNADIFGDGCGPKVVDFFRTHFDAVIGAVLGIAGIELLGMTASMLLFCGLQRVDMLDDDDDI